MRRALFLLCIAATAHADETPAEPEEIVEIVETVTPGSAHAIGEEELERWEKNDIHKVLSSVPGVYVREEDGYGLRPNIGMRGAAAERSAKIALLEDGILIAPAPYSAPAAYYFPTVTRMTKVEVVKGPGAIRFGPNTVGGSVNLVGRVVPAGESAQADLAGGPDGYHKLHGAYGRSDERVGVLIEGVRLGSDGFKQLDGGGPTGFARNDLVGRVRLTSDMSGPFIHQLELKLGWTGETSHETYTGLSVGDFRNTPLRRYAATQRDLMELTHLAGRVSHNLYVRGVGNFTTTAYRHTLQRAWEKLEGFAGQASLAPILAAPEQGNNAVYYAVLTGAADSTGSADTLIVTTNRRRFVSEGVQVDGAGEPGWFGVPHRLEGGLRVHHDRVVREHLADGWLMQAGHLVPAEMPTETTDDNQGSAVAVAAYLRDEVRLGRFLASAGLRAELVHTSFTDRLDPMRDGSGSWAVLIPGAGLVFEATPELNLLAGVHRGFVPVPPGQSEDVRPESSVNYEAGARYHADRGNAEIIGFVSDYANLKGACTLSTGCSSEQLDREYNGGRVLIGGVEAAAAWVLRAGKIELPLRAAYTWNHARFRTSFRSENPQWGEVDSGDELPYLPPHQLSLEAAARGKRWEVAASTKITAAMRDLPGQGAEGLHTDTAWTVDAAAAYTPRPWLRVYATVSNVFDRAHVVSYRPWGARPGAPRLIVLGVKTTY